ncbi:hypothetical protein L0669_21965 [Flavobacterium bizetiae]|uniref:hypothetical protein n=1 Tax=Flavobacterium bizetiae TaxID=2704140 RepID=UPI0021E7CF9A|nr:hypothetical protein [Flavobacterium bizetiae]UTN03977.1 hypothetical protein L0669_21965 [Flavobacterium bizetiae]
MSTNHNRIKVADLETNHPNKILKTNLDGKLEFSDAENNSQPNLTDENFGAFQDSLQTVNTIADKDKLPFLIGSLARMMTWANFKSLFKTIGGNSIFGNGNIATPDMDTTTAQTVSGVKTFLNLMLGLRNAANTFTSFIASTATASRTWTFPDKSGTVAMTSDLPTNIIATGTQNYVPKYNNADGTQVGNSRIKDDGTCIGIDNTNRTLLKDITLGNQNNREIGIEESTNTTKGRDLTLSAGRAINYAPTDFNPYTATAGLYAITVWADPNGDMYLLSANRSVIWFRPSGSSIFSASDISGFTNSLQEAHTSGVTQNGDAYGCNGYKIYKRTGRTGNFVDTGIFATKIACSFNSNDVYYYQNGVGIFKLINGTGSGVNQGVLAGTYDAITYSNLNNVYYMQGTKLYKQTNATGAFTDTLAGNVPSTPNKSMCITPSNDMYVTESRGNISIRANDSGNFVFFQTVPASNYGPSMIATDINNDVYTGEGFANNTVLNWKINSALTGTNDLDGGTNKVKAGTGKGTGKSRVEFYTGQKTVSGTDMQVEKMRVYLDENGSFVYLTPPSYANDTDADADSNLPSKAFYKITGNRTLFQKP